MYEIAKASSAERQMLSQNTASRKGMPAAIIEYAKHDFRDGTILRENPISYFGP